MHTQARIPLDENLLKAMGTFVARFSLLELEVHYLIWRLLVPNQQGIGRLITASMGFQLLLRVAGSLFEYRTRDKKLHKRMRSLVAKLAEANRIRNDMIHSFWVDRPDIEDALVISMQSRPEGYREEVLELDTNTLHRDAERFVTLQSEVQDLHLAIYNSSHSLRVE